MPVQSVPIGNFGAAGYLPDVAPSLLPENGFSYSVNWRFDEGGHATVAAGYADALTTRRAYGEAYQFSNPTANLTFFYTWELSDRNAIVVYDQDTNRFTMIESGSLGDLSEFQLSVRDPSQYSMVYTSSGNPAVGEFTVNGAGQIFMAFQNAVPDSITTAVVPDNEMAIVDNGRNKPTRDLVVSSREIDPDSRSVTVTFDTPLAASFFIDAQEYHIRFAEPRVHGNVGAVKWIGTDALGVPVFNNSVEEPLQFVEGLHPIVDTLSSWPAGGTCSSLTSFGTVLVAVGYVNPQAATDFQGSSRTVAFSNPITTPGVLPSWDFANLQSEAGLLGLELFTDGQLTSGFEANNRFIVNSTTDIIAITDIGGGAYDGTKLEIGGGTLTRRTSIAIPNGFFNIGNGQFYIHDTQSYQRVGQARYSDTWFSIVDEERLNEVVVVYDPRTRSIRIKTPTGPSTQEIWIIDLDNNNSLSVLDDHQEINFLEFSAEGTPAETTTWDSIPASSWETIPQNTWNEFPITELGEFRNRILGCGGRQIFVHDFGDNYNGRVINAVLEKAYFKLGAQDSYSTFQFDRVVPWAEGDDGALLDIRVGRSQSLGSSIDYTQWKTYTIGRSTKLDFRRLARWGAITFRCQTSGVQLSGVEIQVNSAGKR